MNKPIFLLRNPYERSILRFLLTSITVAVFMSSILFAQDSADRRSSPPADDGYGSLYIVTAVALAVWIVISAYLIWIDRKLARLEKELRQGK